MPDLYCPHCLRPLTEGRAGFFFCPDAYSCEYERDELSPSPTLPRPLTKIERLEAEAERLTAERTRTEHQLHDLQLKIAAKRREVIAAKIEAKAITQA